MLHIITFHWPDSRLCSSSLIRVRGCVGSLGRITIATALCLDVRHKLCVSLPLQLIYARSRCRSGWLVSTSIDLRCLGWAPHAAAAATKPTHPLNHHSSSFTRLCSTLGTMLANNHRLPLTFLPNTCPHARVSLRLLITVATVLVFSASWYQATPSSIIERQR